MVVGLLFLILILPYFNSFVDRNIEIDFFHNSSFLPVLLGIILFTGIFSGSYPALFMSTFQPSNILKGSSISGMKSSRLRNILVIAQFSISIALIAGTIIIHKQLQYIKNRNLGYNKEHVVVLGLRDDEVRGNYIALKNELLENLSVSGVSGSSSLQTNISTRVGRARFEGNDGETVTIPVYTAYIDYDYLTVFDIELVDGRDFSRERTSDRAQAVIVNDKTVQQMDWGNPLEKKAALMGIEGYVVGVVKDFHFQSFFQPINTLALILNPENIRYIFVKIKPDNITGTLKFIEKTYKKFNLNHPFEYSFLDDSFDRMYRSEQKLGLMFNYFSGLAIFIACLGLFGLSSYTIERRTKEIGIRKVLGASVSNIIYIFSGEFVKLVLIANIIALPIAYFTMNKWLVNFAYQISIGVWIFILSAAIAFLIALLTVGFQAVKAAVANPVDSLKYE